MKQKTLTTPVATAKWVCVQKPSTKFKADGVYSVEVVMTAEEAKPLYDQLQKMAEEAKQEFSKKFLADPKTKAKAAKLKNFKLNFGFSQELDTDGNETGNLIFKAKSDAVIKPKGKDAWNKKIGLFDAKGKPIVGNLSIGKGTRLKVAFQPYPFCMEATERVGMSIRLEAVQIIELVKYEGGQSAEGYGFGSEEGFTADDDQTSEGTDATGGGGTGDAGNGDF